MIKLLKLSLLAMLGSTLFAQTNQINFSAPPPPPPSGITGSVAGTGGQNTVYYWVIATYPSGDSMPGGPLVLNGSQPVTNLSVSNFNRIRWNAVGVTGVTYTVIRNTISTNPLSSNFCASCNIATNLTSPSYDDVGAATTSYTLTPSSSATGAFALNNTNYSLPWFTLVPNRLPYFQNESKAFADLPQGIGAGTQIFCSNCSVVTPCAAGGSGALAVFNGLAWDCGTATSGSGFDQYADENTFGQGNEIVWTFDVGLGGSNTNLVLDTAGGVEINGDGDLLFNSMHVTRSQNHPSDCAGLADDALQNDVCFQDSDETMWVCGAATCSGSGWVQYTSGVETADITTGLLNHWPMEQTSGTSITDSGSEGTDMSLLNTPTWTNDAALCAVGTQCLTLASASSQSGSAAITWPTTGDFTIAGWILNTSLGEDKYFFAGHNGTDTVGELSLYTSSGGAITAGFDADGTRIQVGTAILANWMHLAITRDDGVLTVWLNAIPVRSAIGTATLAFTTCAFLLGTESDSGCAGSLGNYLNGRVDDVRRYNRALAIIDMQALFALGVIP